MSNPKYYMPGLPHDYYDHDMMHLHIHGNSGPFADPDFTAREADDQLPLISTVGRGPRGVGVEVTDIVDEDNEFRFSLKETINDEVVMVSPNLAPAEITLEQTTPTTVEFTTTKDGMVKKVDTVTLPTGQTGSRGHSVWGATISNLMWTLNQMSSVPLSAFADATQSNYPKAGDIAICKSAQSLWNTCIAVCTPRDTFGVVTVDLTKLFEI